MTGSPGLLVVTGAAGLLGSHLLSRTAAAGFDEVRAIDLAEADLTDPVATARALDGAATVLHGAAWTNVDAAEASEAAAYAVNAVASANVAAACAANGARLIAVSTDYVFPGVAPDGSPRTEPYEPTDPVGPRSAYGRTKLAGELAVRCLCPAAQIVRTSWVYDATRGFVATMRRLEAERDTLTVVADQVGSPTYAGDLAAALLDLASRPDVTVPVLHATGGGATSWHALACEVFRLLGADPARVHPVPTSAYPLPAPRPAYSVLSPAAWAAAGLAPLRPWQDALAEALGLGPDSSAGTPGGAAAG